MEKSDDFEQFLSWTYISPVSFFPEDFLGNPAWCFSLDLIPSIMSVRVHFNAFHDRITALIDCQGLSNDGHWLLNYIILNNQWCYVTGPGILNYLLLLILKPRHRFTLLHIKVVALRPLWFRLRDLFRDVISCQTTSHRGLLAFWYVSFCIFMFTLGHRGITRNSI